MTAADREALVAELEALEGEGRREMAARIKTAREWGDLKENSEYHDAKNDQAHLETKIVILRERLARAKVVEALAGGGVVGLGSVVHVRDGDGREQRFQIVSSHDRRARRGQDLDRVAGRARPARARARRAGDGDAAHGQPQLLRAQRRVAPRRGGRRPKGSAAAACAGAPQLSEPVLREPRKNQQRAARSACQVHCGAAQHQAADRPVATRADDEEIHAGAEEGELLARDAGGDLSLDAVEARRGRAWPPRAPARRPGYGRCRGRCSRTVRARPRSAPSALRRDGRRARGRTRARLRSRASRRSRRRSSRSRRPRAAYPSGATRRRTGAPISEARVTSPIRTRPAKLRGFEPTARRSASRVCAR